MFNELHEGLIGLVSVVEVAPGIFVPEGKE